LPPEEDPSSLLRSGPINVGLNNAGSSKHSVNDTYSASVKPRAGIRDLTKKISITTTQGIKSFLPVTRTMRKRQTYREAGTILSLSSPDKRKAREGICSAAGSDLSDYVEQSPRKIFTAKSPRLRTVSPSPCKPLAKKTMKVIEISSESDSDGPEGRTLIPLCPLLRARARAMTSRHPSTKANLDEDIIDLT
jgi:hypothetical protein